jgi:hypothetical protein
VFIVHPRGRYQFTARRRVMAIHSRWRLRAGQAGVRFPAVNSVGASDNEAMAMTEQEWLACSDPRSMLDFLVGKASRRKLRLFAVGCCRRIWSLLTDERSRRAVDVAEGYTDGLISKELRDLASTDALNASNRATEVFGATDRKDQIAWKANAAADAAADAAFQTVHEGPLGIASVARAAIDAVWDCDVIGDESAQAMLVRDIFGNPFRPATINPAWRTSNVTALAQSIYDDRAFDRLPILADALEDAGCDNADILNHCRQPGVHVRGCWVVDLLLNKE